jgi:hypothetical protein
LAIRVSCFGVTLCDEVLIEVGGGGGGGGELSWKVAVGGGKSWWQWWQRWQALVVAFLGGNWRQDAGAVASAGGLLVLDF